VGGYRKEGGLVKRQMLVGGTFRRVKKPGKKCFRMYKSQWGRPRPANLKKSVLLKQSTKKLVPRGVTEKLNEKKTKNTGGERPARNDTTLEFSPKVGHIFLNWQEVLEVACNREQTQRG